MCLREICGRRRPRSACAFLPLSAYKFTIGIDMNFSDSETNLVLYFSRVCPEDKSSFDAISVTLKGVGRWGWGHGEGGTWEEATLCYFSVSDARQRPV